MRLAAVYWKRRRDFHRSSNCRIVNHLVIYSAQNFKLLPDIPLFSFGSGSSQCGGELMHPVRSRTSKAAEARAPRFRSPCCRVTLDLSARISGRSISSLNSVLILLSLVRVVISSKLLTLARSMIRRQADAGAAAESTGCEVAGKVGHRCNMVLFNSIVCYISLSAYWR
jgi:hypothetical protein